MRSASQDIAELLAAQAAVYEQFLCENLELEQAFRSETLAQFRASQLKQAEHTLNWSDDEQQPTDHLAAASGRAVVEDETSG